MMGPYFVFLVESHYLHVGGGTTGDHLQLHLEVSNTDALDIATMKAIFNKFKRF
jgi:hypothetical protein